MTSNIYYNLMPMYNGLLLNGALELISKNLTLPDPVIKNNNTKPTKDKMYYYLVAATCFSSFEKLLTYRHCRKLRNGGYFEPSNGKSLCQIILEYHLLLQKKDTKIMDAARNAKARNKLVKLDDITITRIIVLLSKHLEASDKLKESK